MAQRRTPNNAWLSEQATKVLAFIREHPGCTSRDIANGCGIEQKRVREIASVSLVSFDLVRVEEAMIPGVSAYVLTFYAEEIP